MKHGREYCPWQRVQRENGGLDYVACCAECQRGDTVSAPRWLPDAVVVAKFVNRGWVGEGHAAKGIPARLVCQACAMKKAAPPPPPKPVRPVCAPREYRPAPSTRLAMCREAFENGHQNSTEVLAYIKEQWGLEVPRSNVSAYVSKLRKEAGLPVQKRRPRRLERRPDQAPPTHTPREELAAAFAAYCTAKGIDLARGEELVRELITWANAVGDAGLRLRVEIEQDRQTERIERINLMLRGRVEQRR